MTLEEALCLLRIFDPTVSSSGSRDLEYGSAPIGECASAKPEHSVVAVLEDEGSDVGFVYTVGLHDRGKAELLCDPVKRGDVRRVCALMNFLAERDVLPGQTAQAGTDDDSPKFRFRLPSQKERSVLMRTKTCMCHKHAVILVLEPLIE